MSNGITNIYKTGATADEIIIDEAADGYRLPTLEQWQYAARGGLSSLRFPWSDNISHEMSNYKSDPEQFDYDSNIGTGSPFYHPDYIYPSSEAPPYTCEVNHLAPNGYGLYHIVGNVSEWCWDPVTGSGRYVAGGSYASDPSECRIMATNTFTASSAADYIGFRTVLKR